MRMTRQRSFNRFYKHFVIEGNPQCISDEGVCKYSIESEAGWFQGCAIGIQPEFRNVYQKGFEQVGIVTLWNSRTEVQSIIRREDLDFFESLQMLHDNRLLDPDFETHYIPKFIKEWYLNPPKPRKDKDNERSKN